MVLPSIGVGEGGSFSFGADSGPIHSADVCDTGFNTGPFKTSGGAMNNIALVIAGAAVAGLLVWLLLSHSSR